VTPDEPDDELAFLLNSLEDLERERAAGDLSDADYGALGDRYTRRAAQVLRARQRDTVVGPEERADKEEDATGPTAAGAKPPVRRRRGLLVGGVLALGAALAVTLVVTQTGARLPGQTASGSVSLSRGAQMRRTLAQAQALESSGDDAQALRLFSQVLAQDPTQPEALAESGWLEFEAGAKSRDAAVLSHAQDTEQAAERAEPGAYVPHLYLGSMLLAEGSATGAVSQYRQFLADAPPSSEVQVARALITEAFRQAGQPVPAVLSTAAGATPSTTVRPAG
jgi:tetratricopeptide (TPR) repeat protein